ncbi:MAG: hypothetical protein ACTHOK_07385 [Nocardioidaceae bacterium]
MTAATTMASSSPVTVTDTGITISHLTVANRESAAIARACLTDQGPQALADLVARAVQVGLVALSVGAAGLDTGTISRTLDDFAERVDAKTQSALAGMDETLRRLQAGEQQVARVAQEVLGRLPQQVEAALAGASGDVRTSVGEAARTAQSAALDEVRRALAQHSTAMRDALSLDRDGPVQALRRDVLEQVHASRQELGEQLTQMRALLQAAEAHKAASAKSTRAIGLEWENQAMAIADEVITAAGDRFEPTGSTPAPGGTSRAGDGIATLCAPIAHGRPVRIVVEAKRRSKPLTARQLREELNRSRNLRQAAAGLVLVPTSDEVPGGGRWARVDDASWVVAADDPTVVSLCYLILREMTALLTVRQDDGDEIDLAKVEAHLKWAMSALTELDEVGRLATSAERNLNQLKVVGAGVQKKIRDALTNGLAALHT